MTSLTYAARALIALLIAFFATFVAISPASAHGGEYDIEFDQDGLGGVTAFAVYAADGHTVDAVMDVTATAAAADGRTLGPVHLVSSPEGQGLWITTEPFLDQGVWTVTVATTQPHPTSASKEIEVVFADQNPPSPTSDASTSSTDASNDGLLIPLLIAGGAIAVAAIVVVLVARRARARSH